MENARPPTDALWAARGTKRTHNQMSGREPSTSSPPPQSRRTRSPSVLSSTRAGSTTSTPSHTQSGSASSSEQPTPLRPRTQGEGRFTPRREREIDDLLELSRPPPGLREEQARREQERTRRREAREARERLASSRPPPSLVRLPSFQELDAERARRDRDRDRDMSRLPDPLDELLLVREENVTRQRELERLTRDRERRHGESRQRLQEGALGRAGPAAVTIDLTSDAEERPAPPAWSARLWFNRETNAWENPPPQRVPGAVEVTRPERERAGQPFGHARRGPRFPAEIIDLSGDTPRGPPRPAAAQQVAVDVIEDDDFPMETDNAPTAQNHAHQDPASSPEVTFLRARAISPRVLNADATQPTNRPPNRLNPLGNIAPIEIVDDEDDFVIVRERIVPDVPRHRLDQFLENFTGAMPDARQLRRAFGDAMRMQRRARVIGQRAPPARGGGRFVPPVMDFGQVAFDLGYPPRMMEPEEREPSPIPNLPPVPEGFTRNPVEEDVLVCPACECELSVGELEEEVKRQVWMVKKCGHVYCGECAASRLQKLPKKGKEPKDQAPPLKKCAVAGCEAKTTGKQMVQLFL